MELRIGGYHLTFPDAALADVQIQDAQTLQSDSVSITFGPFRLSVSLSDSSLESWREFVGYTTKHEAIIKELEINGIPGFTLPPSPLNHRRLDYFFQAPNSRSLTIVAWSDEPTSLSQREAVDLAVQTLQFSEVIAQ